MILGRSVVIKESGEVGKVVGVAQFTHGRTASLVRYCNSVGVAVELWWDDDALEIVEVNDNDMAS